MKPSIPVKLPFFLIIIFALGQMGWSLASFSVANLLSYFYMPPEDSLGNSFFPYLIPQSALLGSLTILGIISFSSRLFDAVTDPPIAHMSDRSQSRLGRRKFFMLIGATPLALFSFLVFYPPFNSIHQLNVLWLSFTIFAFYIAFTLYVTPFNALIAELGHTSEERLNISTWISVTWALGFALGNQIYNLQSWAMDRYQWSATTAFQNVLMFFGLVSWVLMMLPIVFISEKKYALAHSTNENIYESLKATFRDKNFLNFLSSDLFYWMSLSFIQLGMSYYIIVLLEMPASQVSFLMLLLFVLSFVFYFPINFFARRWGKRSLMILAFILLCGVFVLASQLGVWDISKNIQAYSLAVLASLPIAIFGILPSAIIADMAQDASKLDANNRTAMYYGTRTLAMKLGISAANLIFPSLLLAGKGVGNDLGIRLSAYLAIVFSIIGLVFFSRIKQKVSEEPSGRF
jgi:glycoside/pentoside/hexuronide:cation symporter, GPH family